MNSPGAQLESSQLPTEIHPDPTVLGLPAAYRQQSAARTRDDWDIAAKYWTPSRIADSARYQSRVYEWAARVVRARSLRSILDVGSGPGVKLGKYLAEVCDDLSAVDQPSALTVAASLRVPAKLRPIDLERPGVPWRAFDLVLCADVIEHVVNPLPLLEYLRRALRRGGYVLISTPERARLRGRACMACEKPEHIREWERGEFLWLLKSQGFEVLRSRLLPQDESRRAEHRQSERAFRAGDAERSPLCCHAVLCRAVE